MVDLNLTKRSRRSSTSSSATRRATVTRHRARIGKAVGLASSSTVHAHLANLEKVGCCGATRRSRARSRCSTRPSRASKSVVRPSGLPLVGQVAAGQPVLAEENIEEYVEVPGLAGGADGEYLLRVRGDSMKDAGILEGDHVAVRPQSTAKTGRSWSRWWARRQRSSASSRRPTTCACSRRTRRWSRSAPARYVSLAGSSASCGRSRDDASRRRIEHPGAAESSGGPTLEHLIAGVWHDLASPRERGVPALRRGDVTVVRRAWHVHRVRTELS